MAETDSLGKFDFNKVSKPGKFLKFEAGKSVVVRILTKDPVVSETAFTNAGETSMSTKFNFIVWNFTDDRAQILGATPKMAATFQRIGNDTDYGANLQKCDIKISPEGEKLNRIYDINVLYHSGNEKPITQAMIDEAQKINLDEDVKDSKGRLSKWEPPAKKPIDDEPPADLPDEQPPEDVVIEDIGDEPINLDDIPF